MRGILRFIGAVVAVLSGVALLVNSLGIVTQIGAIVSPDGIRAALSDRVFQNSAAQTFFPAAISTASCLVLCAPVAYWLNRGKFPGKTGLICLLIFPAFLPPLVISPLIAGAFDMLQGFRPADPGNWLTQLQTGILGAVVAESIVTAPLALVLFLVVFRTIPTREARIAQSLGVSPRLAFNRLVWPQIRGITLAAIVLIFLRAACEYGSLMSLYPSPLTHADNLLTSTSRLVPPDGGGAILPIVSTTHLAYLILAAAGVIAFQSFFGRLRRC